MAVDLFAAIDRSKVDVLPFLKGHVAFGYVDSSIHSRLGIVYEIGVDDCRKITKLFNGKEDKKIMKGDRVFVLSGCKVPQFKIKEFCRGIGAVMVSEIEDATIFVGNNRIYQEHEGYGTATIDSLSMIMDMTYGEAYSEKGMDDNFTGKIDGVLRQYYPDPVTTARFTKYLSATASYVSIGSVRQMFCITPYAARVAYEILSRSIPTITEESLFKQLPTAAVLDKHLCEQTIAMMRSSDEENHKVAHEILANSDYSNSDLYLFKIAKESFFQINSSRYKNVRLFVQESKLSAFYAYSEEGFLKHLMENGKLDKEAIEVLMPVIAADVKATLQRNRSSVFNIKLELRPDLAAILGEHSYDLELGLLPINTKQNDDDDDTSF